MRKIASFLSLFVAGILLTPLAARTQAPGPGPSLIERLNKEASSTDAEGLHAYSKDLIDGLVGNNAGPAYAASAADRLAQAELLARQAKRKLVSEADIVEAFNGLMKKTGAPDSLRADLDAVRKNRESFASEAPKLISSRSNGSYCNPGEAIFVLGMLIENVGITRTPPTQAGPHAVTFQMPPARGHLQAYFVKHSLAGAISAFNEVFSIFKI